MATIQEIIDAINNGTKAEKETLAQLIIDIDNSLADTTRTNNNNAQTAGKTTAKTSWYDATIAPTLTWNSKQTTKTQITNSFADRDTLEALTETDQYRQLIIKDEINTITKRISDLKNGT